MKILKSNHFSVLLLLLSLGTLSSCDYVERFEAKARKINHYEVTALQLAKENRELKTEIIRLQDQIQTLKSEKNYIQIKLDKYEQDKPTLATVTTETSRGIASVNPKQLAADPKNDLVKFDVYKWTPSQILAMAEKEFAAKNYEKSAQFFTTFTRQFPHHERISDQVLFQAGVAAYESGDHQDWTLKHLEKLVEEYPTSKYYRGAKLWIALTYLDQGKDRKFFDTVEEFRKKYRNTDEWKVLSPHYEKIVQKYKKN